jgi:competence protein ComEC
VLPVAYLSLYHDLPFARQVKAVALLLIFVTVLAGLPYQKPDGLRVTFLDVGQGSSILVETKSGKNLLIDGGGSDNDLEWAGESVVVPYLYQHRIKYLNYMICTHPHADHAGGLLTF